MLSIRLFALVTWILIASLATAGFATFSPRPPDEKDAAPTTTTGAPDVSTTGGEAVGRVAALALTNGLTNGLEERSQQSEQGVKEPGYAALLEGLEREATTTTSSAPPPPPSTSTSAAVGAAPTTAPLTTPPTPPPAPVTTAGLPAHSIGPCPASWYGEYFRGRRTASGEPYDPDGFTAAHRSLAFGSVVTVTRVDTGASVTVRINDRGPFAGSRCIDLSRAAMSAIGGIGAGVITVVVSY